MSTDYSDPTFQVQGIEDAIKKINFLSSLKMNDEYLVPAMKKIGGAVRKAEISRVPVFTGSLKKSISNSVTQNGVGSVTAKIGSKKRSYILRFLEQGASWGDKNPPVREKKLVAWVTQKLGAQTGALRVAFAVARSIQQRGLKARPIVKPTVEETRDMVVRETNKAVEKMVNDLGRKNG